MSQTYDLVCMDCDESIWISQSNYHDKDGVNLNLYSGDSEVMEGLRRFLWKHMGHKLWFGDEGFLQEMKDWGSDGS